MFLGMINPERRWFGGTHSSVCAMSERLSAGLIASPHVDGFPRNKSRPKSLLTSLSRFLLPSPPCFLPSTTSLTGACGTYYLSKPETPSNNYRDYKRRERATRFASLPASYRSAFTAFDRAVINKPIEQLVQEVQESSVSATDVLHTYGKVAVHAQEKTNCVTELLLPEAEKWAQSEVNLQGPLAGIPVSLKDSIQVGGFDTSVGYTRMSKKPTPEDGALVRLLKDAGAPTSPTP